MMLFTHTSTDFAIETKIKLGRSAMYVTLGELPEADFICDNGIQTLFSTTPNPAIVAAILHFQDVPAWKQEHDDAGVLSSICELLRNKKFGYLAQSLEERQDELLASGHPLKNQWVQGLADSLADLAAPHCHSPADQKLLEKVLRQAHPLQHIRKNHRLADHFIHDVWPIIFMNIRKELLT